MAFVIPIVNFLIIVSFNKNDNIIEKIKKDSVEIKKNCDMTKRISIRDRLLVKEIQEMENTLPSTCRVTFSDPNILYEFILCICPDEGFGKGAPINL